MPRGSQLARQWQLLQLLGQPAGLTVEDGARQLGCTVRTVWRDLRALQDGGLPIYDERNGRHGVWRVERSFQDRLPIPLSLPEIVALLVSRDLLAPAGAGPLAPAIASTFAKLRALLTPRALELIDRLRAAVDARALGAKPVAGTTEMLQALHSALLERRALRVRYYSMSRDSETERRIDPYHLTYFNGGLYLVGFCHLRRAVRTFAVERIRSLERLEATFTVPADFRPDEYLCDAWGIVRGELVTVKAVFSKAVARYVKERVWHPSQNIRDLPGGRVELTLRVADTVEVKRWLLGFGADGEVLAPRSLRDALRAEAERLVALLGEARKPPARAGAPARRRRPTAVGR